jgi:MGT family glycosyltransferase
MKVLMISIPATGHLNPLLAIAYSLLGDGHDVTIVSGSRLRSRVEAIGAKFRTLGGNADFDPSEVLANTPELKELPPGHERSRLIMERYLIDPIPAQLDALQQAIRDDQPDVIIADDMMLGVLPMLLGPRAGRLPIVACGTSVLHVVRDDKAPSSLGLPPAVSQADHDRYAALAEEHARDLHAALERHLNQTLAKVGGGSLPLPDGLFNSIAGLADAYLQLSVPAFEFPRKQLPPTVHFVGCPPIIPNQAPLPPWAGDLDGTRKVVLVTQGTVANQNFDLLIGPTLTGLAHDPDVLVIATTGGRPVDTVLGAIPSNARVASFLPFEWALEKADAFVTNGGYGSVNQALSFGIPVVCAGQTEDKADVSARVAWSGVGIDLKTNQPSPQGVREAVRAVLDQPGYRARAKTLAEEYARLDMRTEVPRIVTDLVNGRKAADVIGRLAAG